MLSPFFSTIFFEIDNPKERFWTRKDGSEEIELLLGCGITGANPVKTKNSFVV